MRKYLYLCDCGSVWLGSRASIPTWCLCSLFYVVYQVPASYDLVDALLAVRDGQLQPYQGIASALV